MYAISAEGDIVKVKNLQSQLGHAIIYELLLITFHVQVKLLSRCARLPFKKF